jgi:hypothetical protein
MCTQAWCVAPLGCMKPRLSRSSASPAAGKEGASHLNILPSTRPTSCSAAPRGLPACLLSCLAWLYRLLPLLITC